MSTPKRKRHGNEGAKGIAANQPIQARKDDSSSCGWQYMPKDLLTCILSFFFSEDSQNVDESSILSVMLVSKHWNDVATSPSLWRMPYQGSFRLSIVHALKINTSSDLYCSGASADEKTVHRPSSFLGFAKLESAKCKLAPRHLRSKEVLNHIFFHRVHLCTELFCIMGSNWQRIVLVYRDVSRHPPGSVDFQSRADRLVEENLQTPVPSYMRLVLHQFLGRCQPSTHPISTAQWAIIVDWVFEVAGCFDIDVPVVFSAMELFRRFLDHYFNDKGHHPPFSKYQCLASASLLVAAKCNFGEILPEDLARAADLTFTVEQLLLYEGAILSTLEWDLYSHTIIEDVFYSLSEELQHASQEATLILTYLSSLALQSQIFTIMDFSRLAAAIIMMARYWLQLEGLPLWSDGHDEPVGASFEEICRDVVTLSNHLDGIRQQYPHLKVITRYHNKQLSSGELTVPLITSTAQLVAYQTRSGGPNLTIET